MSKIKQILLNWWNNRADIWRVIQMLFFMYVLGIGEFSFSCHIKNPLLVRVNPVEEPYDPGPVGQDPEEIKAVKKNHCIRTDANGNYILYDRIVTHMSEKTDVYTEDFSVCIDALQEMEYYHWERWKMLAVAMVCARIGVNDIKRISPDMVENSFLPFEKDLFDKEFNKICKKDYQ